jgi:hypothetical protein
MWAKAVVAWAARPGSEPCKTNPIWPSRRVKRAEQTQFGDEGICAKWRCEREVWRFSCDVPLKNKANLRRCDCFVAPAFAMTSAWAEPRTRPGRSRIEARACKTKPNLEGLGYVGSFGADKGYRRPNSKSEIVNRRFRQDCVPRASRMIWARKASRWVASRDLP